MIVLSATCDADAVFSERSQCLPTQLSACLRMSQLHAVVDWDVFFDTLVTSSMVVRRRSGVYVWTTS